MGKLSENFLLIKVVAVTGLLCFNTAQAEDHIVPDFNQDETQNTELLILETEAYWTKERMESAIPVSRSRKKDTI